MGLSIYITGLLVLPLVFNSDEFLNRWREVGMAEGEPVYPGPT